MYIPGYDGYLLPLTDEFRNNDPHVNYLKYHTGFTGSNGLALFIQGQEGLFFTDGRYTQQAQRQVRELRVVDTAHIAEIDWASYRLKRVAYSPFHFTRRQIAYYRRFMPLHPVEGIPSSMEIEPRVLDVFRHDCSSTTKEQKLQDMRNWMAAKGLEAYLIASSEVVSWLTHLRCKNNGISLTLPAYALVDTKRVTLFVASYDTMPGYETLPLESVIDTLKGYDAYGIDLDDALDAFGLENAQKVVDPWMLQVATKDAHEIQGSRQAHVLDAISLIEGMVQIQEERHQLDEYRAGLILSAHRARHPEYIKDSFSPICAMNANAGSIIHYRAQQDQCLPLSEGLLLLDSGGHYSCGGTTDVTRVLCFGQPSAEHRLYYTLVLKGHIALARARFPEGTTGAQLDALARQYLWQHGYNYPHSTGHGVGNCLNVHEGPQGIGSHNMVPLRAGMIVSNEPGAYFGERFGIRIENLQVVEHDTEPGWLRFAQLTLVPYNRELIDLDMCSDDERAYLRDYYGRIETEIVPHLSQKARIWTANELAL